MKKTLWILPLLAVAAACNNAPANNVAANQTSGLPLPPDRAGTPPVPAPAEEQQQAALPAGLNCVRDRLTSEQRQAIGQAVLAQAPREDPRAQSLLQAADACATELSWSPQKRQLATLFSMSAAGAATLREWFRGRGIQIQQLDQVILSDGELMNAAESGSLTAQVGESFAMRHQAELDQLAPGWRSDRELGTRIGNYMGFMAGVQVNSRRFASAA